VTITNQALSDQRAYVVQMALMEIAISSNRVNTRGYFWINNVGTTY
jgi:outer membrane protein OmpA-like peptidoglycan-associated protein